MIASLPLRLLQRCLLALMVALLSACSSLVVLPGAEPDALALSKPQAQAAWARVLSQYVNERGLVDFAGLAKAPQDLYAVVRYVATTKVELLATPSERLAHHINAYNALSMFNVIDLGLPASNTSLASRYRFFIGRKHQIGGQTQSLYDYENLVIRKLGEPRIHWALNCSALSCPVLPRQPFTAAMLDAELERESRAFFANPQNLRVDHNTRTVFLSEILNFFPEDFVPAAAPNLIAYVKRYSPMPLDESYRVDFIPYDWTIAHWRK
jgi:Protein of unknown function, DUF547